LKNDKQIEDNLH